MSTGYIILGCIFYTNFMNEFTVRIDTSYYILQVYIKTSFLSYSQADGY